MEGVEAEVENEEEAEEDDEKEDEDVDEEGELGGDRYGGLSAWLAALSFDLERWFVWLLPSDGLECEAVEPEVGAEEPFVLEGSEAGLCEV